MSEQVPYSRVIRRIPGPPLCQHIERLWYSTGRSNVPGYESVLPTGTLQLVIRLHQEPIRRFEENTFSRIDFQHAVVSGAHSRPFVKATYRRSSVIGVHFRPAGAALFFAEPLGRLSNSHLAAEDFWGRQIRELREQLLEVASPRAMFDLLEAALIRRMVQPTKHQQIIQQAVNRFVAEPASTTMRQVGDATGYSPKRFIQLFQDYVGLTPKLFCRVLRFQTVLERVGKHAAVDWAKLAVDCGYFDQSHLIRDFREFAGIRPSEYRPATPNRWNHIAINPDIASG
jgi:AraC-like DNA-binding protein